MGGQFFLTFLSAIQHKNGSKTVFKTLGRKITSYFASNQQKRQRFSLQEITDKKVIKACNKPAQMFKAIESLLSYKHEYQLFFITFTCECKFIWYYTYKAKIRPFVQCGQPGRKLENNELLSDSHGYFSFCQSFTLNFKGPFSPPTPFSQMCKINQLD